MDEFALLEQMLDDFVAERDWGQFHTPRNLALALGGEVGELQAELQWLSDTSVGDDRTGELSARLSSEVADVLIYLLLFSKSCQIDILAAARDKLGRNQTRFPAEEVKGRATNTTD